MQQNENALKLRSGDGFGTSAASTTEQCPFGLVDRPGKDVLVPMARRAVEMVWTPAAIVLGFGAGDGLPRLGDGGHWGSSGVELWGSSDWDAMSLSTTVAPGDHITIVLVALPARCMWADQRPQR